MHRFRKKSDAKRAQVPDTLSSSNPRSPQQTVPNLHNNTPDTLPSLPPASDFRTSLILPSLSRRFTLLRNSNGDPVSINDMRARFAEQRARGAEHQISEEEEDMIVQALGELQSSNVAASQSSNVAASQSSSPSNTTTPFSPGADSIFASQQNLSAGGDSDYPMSIRSGTASFLSSPSSVYPRSTPSSISTSRTSTSPRYSIKRNSNNLFGSGRFHDTSYLHSISKASVASSRSTTSLTGSDSHGGSVRSVHSTRAADPQQVLTSDADSNGDPASPPDKASSKSLPVSSHSILSPLPPRLSKEFTIQQVRRTSLALEEVIRGIEEEAEETIMVPRTSVPKSGALNPRTQSPKHSESPSSAGTPIPWMTDEARVDDRDEDEPAPSVGAHTSVTSATSATSATSVPHPPSPGPLPRPGTTSPTPRLPGYIPGMTRPLTPRDADSDGGTGYSTTPRARSPAQSHHPHNSNHTHSLSFTYPRHQTQSSISSEGQSILPPSILRSSRGSAQMSPLRTTSPGLGNRSRGNSSSSPLAPSPVPSPGPEERLKSDLLARRPLSPSIGSLVNGYSISRPGTPSGAWQPSSPLAQMHTAPPTPPNDESSQPDLGGLSRHESFVSGASQHTDSMLVPMPHSASALHYLPIRDGRQGTSGTVPSGGWIPKQQPIQNRNGSISSNGALAVPHDQSVSSFPSTVAAKIAARPPTPVHTHTRSPTVNDSGNGSDSILLNRTVSKRTQKRMRSPTPPPRIQHHAQTPPLALHTPSSSSNSSSNVNLHLYPNTNQLFSPMLNTSATSLLSAGSSYHSWADENIKKSGWDQLVEYDSQRSAWQDILDSGARAQEASDASDAEGLGGPEQLLRSVTGLTKGDLGALQKKLVTDALSRKCGYDPPRSPTRRRRMSNPRGSFSALQSGRDSGNNSPGPVPPQTAPPSENGHMTSSEHGHMPSSPDPTSRANALLDSVLNSIQSQSVSSTKASTSVSSDNPSSVEPLSSTDDDISSKFPSVSSSRESHEDDTSALRYKALADALAESESVVPGNSQDQSPIATEPVQSPEEDSGEATEVPASHWRNPSGPMPAPVYAGHNVQLVQDVSRKAAEATAALKNPSQVRNGELDGTLRRRPTKRIDLQQISSPQLVSSSTSVNAIPISHNVSPQPSSPVSDPRSPLKLGQRLKRLRGTLRAKPPSRDGDEGTTVVPHQMDSSQSPIHQLSSPTTPAQSLMYTHHHDSPASATEMGRFKVPVPSPPASAGPGLKGFMARFRKPRKDTHKESANIFRDQSGHQSPDSVSPTSPPHERVDSNARVSSASAARPRQSEDHFSMSASRARSPTPDPATVNQLFDAASQLGLDRDALDALLARSTSTSSRNTAWTPSAAGFAGRRSTATTISKAPVPRPREDHSFDRSRTPESYKQPSARPNAVNRHPDGEIVRRTIIFANDNPSTPDLNGLAQKDSRQLRSPSATSFHSVNSTTQQPPVPRLPVGLGGRTHSAKPSESGSFYDAYTQDQSIPGVQNASAEGPLVPAEEQNQGPALEVLHLSNGQVIWSVLDSLRAAADEEDSESLFRRSMTSSRGGNDGNDDMEVRFKEHRRLDSKGSNYSQGSQPPRRRQTGPSGPRPETKLYKTNSSTIGRLIEDLSKNMDSGSFNFMRAAAPATSSSSTSFHSDASGPSHQVERELEALLNVINPRPSS